MKYRSKTFESGFELEQYLNKCRIRPENIISITMSTCKDESAAGVDMRILLIYVFFTEENF